MQPKQEELLLKKAEQDEYVLDKLLPDSEAPIEIFGFHAQQAAEKILKAILVAHQIPYPATHRIAEILDLARAQGVEVPEQFEDLRYLTPFAVEFRYGIFPPEPEDPLDKDGIRQLLSDLRIWAEKNIQQK